MDNIIQDFAENFIRHIEKYVDNLFGIKRYQRLDKGLELDLVEKAEEYSSQVFTTSLKNSGKRF